MTGPDRPTLEVDPGALSGEPEDDPSIAARGSQIGRYRVEGELGAGGMGVVHVAFDPELDRRVALKLVRPDGGSAKGDSAGRLMREAEAMARVAHPNMVEIYDVGTYRQRVFIAMELVDGSTLGQWLRGGSPDASEILGVFRQAGRGLAAAHASGLVHRDFKPSNVLVGSDGRVRVTDFGLAAFVAIDGDAPSAESFPGRQRNTNLTETGFVMGTPQYMAPEQHDGRQADAACDQFSFCVALYRALYGVHPFAGRARELRAAIASGELQEPSAQSEVPRRIRVAIVRGLSNDPAERWPSMNALLRELEPHSGRRVGFAALGLGLAISAGIFVATQHPEAATPAPSCSDAAQQVTKVWNNDTKDAVREAFVAIPRPYAEHTWAQVEANLDAYSTYWTSAHEEVCRATQVEGRQSAEELDFRMACLRRGLAELSALAGVLAESDASVMDRAVRASAALHRPAVCISAVRDEAIPVLDPASAASVEKLEKRLAEVRALKLAGGYQQGAKRAEQLLTEAKALGHRPTEARAGVVLGTFQLELNQTKEAEQSLSAAGLLASSLGLHAVAATAYTRLLFLLGYRESRFDDALEWARHARAAVDRLGPGEAGLIEAELLNSLGVVLEVKGDFEKARDNFRRAIEIREREVGPRDVSVAYGLNGLAVTLDRLGDRDGSRRAYERALDIKREVLGHGHPSVALTLSNLSGVSRLQGDLDRALASLEEALGIWQHVYPSGHPRFATVHANLGNVLTAQKRFDEAHEHYDRALTIWRASTEGAPPPEMTATLSNKAYLFHGQGKSKEAEELFRQALELTERTLGTQHASYAMTTAALGATLVQRDPEQSSKLLARALDVLRSAGAAETDLAHVRFDLARARWATATGNREAILEEAKAARHLFASRFGGDPDAIASMDAWLGKVDGPP